MLRIRLPQGLFALIDDEDEGVVAEYKWGMNKSRHTHYALSYAPTRIFMHRLILGAPEHLEVDHKNRNGLDNRRSNLRLCTRQQNSCNQKMKSDKKASVYRGVSINNDRWRSQITVNQKAIHLGYFESDIEAAKAYDAAAKMCFGEFATLNFP